MSVFHITTEKFQGPIELLLEVIQERKLPINEISLAAITDDYLKKIVDHPQWSYDESTQFMVIVAILILLKSKSLLPTLVLTEEEQENITDLERRLKLYHLYQQQGQQLQERYGTYVLYTKRPYPQQVVFVPDDRVGITHLQQSLSELFRNMESFQKKALPQRTMHNSIHIDDMIQRIRTALSVVSGSRFSEITSSLYKDNPEHKSSYVLVGFLALLEMVRLGSLHVNQSETFDDIIIHKV